MNILLLLPNYKSLPSQARDLVYKNPFVLLSGHKQIHLCYGSSLLQLAH